MVSHELFGGIHFGQSVVRRHGSPHPPGRGPHPLRPLPHRLHARGQSAHRPLHLAHRPPCRRQVHPAHRGHRPGPSGGGRHRGHLQHPAQVRPHLGRGPRRGRPRGPLHPDRAPGPLRQVRQAPGGAGPRLLLLLRKDRVRGGQRRFRPPRRSLPHPLPRGGQGQGGSRRPLRHPAEDPQGRPDHLPRRRLRRHHRGERHPGRPGPHQAGRPAHLQLRQRHRRPPDGHHPRGPGQRVPLLRPQVQPAL